MVEVYLKNKVTKLKQKQLTKTKVIQDVIKSYVTVKRKNIVVFKRKLLTYDY